VEGAREVAAPVEAAGRTDTSDIAKALGAFGAAPVAPAQTVREDGPQTQLCAVQGQAPPVAPAMWDEEAAEDAPPAGEHSALRPGADRGLAGHITLVNALRLSGGSAAATQGDDHSADAGDEVAAPDNDAMPDSSLPASASPPMMRSHAPQAGVAAPGAREKSDDQAAPRDAGPNGGDVFLDGMLVGRWMSRFLNREVGRASAGPTGFDARRGMLLPGVTVGG